MMKSKDIFIFSFFLASLSFEVQAQNIEGEEREARLFFEAGDFNRAIIQYKNMQGLSLLPWQQAIITYNLGTSKLGCLKTTSCEIGQENLAEALSIFQSINIDDQSLPLLSYRMQINMALVRLSMAQAQSKAIRNNPDASLEDYSAIVRSLQEAAAEIAKIDSAWCQLSKAEGATTCEVSIEASEMHIELKRQYAQTLQDIHDLMLVHPSVQTGSIMLLTGSKAALKHVDFLNERVFDDNLKTEYVNFFLRQDNSWMPLWEVVGQLIKQDPDKEKQNIFQKASKNFSAGTTAMKKQEFLVSQKAFKLSINELNAFVQLIFGDKNAEDIVQRILIQYTLVLLNEPLQELDLQSLIEIQTLLEDPLKERDNEKLNKIFQTAQRTLNAALNSLQNDGPIHAQIYAEAARYQIKQLSQSLKVSKETSTTILKQMIDMQEQAIVLNRLRISMDGKETSDPEIDVLIRNTQSYPFQFVDTFYQAVIAQQKEDEKSPQGNSKKRNLQVPWDEVLPLVDAGTKTAKQAEKFLSAPTLQSRPNALNLQLKTLASWNEALAKMQKKTKSDTKQKEEQPSQEQHSAENKEQQPQSNEPEKTSIQEPGGSSLNDVLRSLQEMENDDRSQPYFKTSANKEVERPW